MPPLPLIIGAAILDISAGPVDAGVFASGSHPVENIRLGFGGDALNEATVLARLGHSPRLVSKIGSDDAGSLVLRHCQDNGVDTGSFIVQEGLDTGVNLVLVSPDGERSFVTASKGSLRSLAPADLTPALFAGAALLSFASIFVFPHFTPADYAALFAAAKAEGLPVCADITKRKNGETLADMRGAFAHVDYLFPNYEEARLLTGLDAVEDIADALLGCGIKHAVIKMGGEGCFVKTPGFKRQFPAHPTAHPLDTTGAGDTFAAGFISALLEHRPLADCTRWGIAASSLAIEAVGATTGVTSRAQVETRLASYPY